MDTMMMAALAHPFQVAMATVALYSVVRSWLSGDARRPSDEPQVRASERQAA